VFMYIWDQILFEVGVRAWVGEMFVEALMDGRYQRENLLINLTMLIYHMREMMS